MGIQLIISKALNGLVYFLLLFVVMKKYFQTGVERETFQADLVLFNGNKFRYRATFMNPIKFSIHVFTWKRQLALQRLCESLLEAEYYGDVIDLVFHIDGDPCPLVLDFCDRFHWPFGEKKILASDTHKGLPFVIFFNSSV